MSGARAEIASRFVDQFEGRDNINLMARIGWCFFHPVKWVRKAWHISYPSRSFRISGFTIKSLGTVRARAPCMKTLQKSLYLWSWCQITFELMQLMVQRFCGVLLIRFQASVIWRAACRLDAHRMHTFVNAWVPSASTRSVRGFASWRGNFCWTIHRVFFCSTFWSFKMNGQRTWFWTWPHVSMSGHGSCFPLLRLRGKYSSETWLTCQHLTSNLQVHHMAGFFKWTFGQRMPLQTWLDYWHCWIVFGFVSFILHFKQTSHFPHFTISWRWIFKNIDSLLYNLQNSYLVWLRNHGSACLSSSWTTRTKCLIFKPRGDSAMQRGMKQTKIISGQNGEDNAIIITYFESISS